MIIENYYKNIIYAMLSFRPEQYHLVCQPGPLREDGIKYGHMWLLHMIAITLIIWLPVGETKLYFRLPALQNPYQP